MTKFLLSIVGLFFTLGVGILVMIHGWGLEPKSWGWILGGSLVAVLIGALFRLADD